ncbi:unnamed protein product [Ectocarpus fasciculatus]
MTAFFAWRRPTQSTSANLKCRNGRQEGGEAAFLLSGRKPRRAQRRMPFDRDSVCGRLPEMTLKS